MLLIDFTFKNITGYQPVKGFPKIAKYRIKLLVYLIV